MKKSELKQIIREVIEESKILGQPQLVKIKPEYLEDGEDYNFLYEVVEDNGDRLLITPKESDLFIPPINLIRRYMLDFIDE